MNKLTVASLKMSNSELLLEKSLIPLVDFLKCLTLTDSGQNLLVF